MEQVQYPVSVGLYGKHPGFGDFLTAGLDVAAQQALENWLGQVMPQIRDGWGEHWGPAFDASPVIRFWFGGDVIGAAGPLCGVIAPSRDKVGRRFPLIAAMSGAAVPAPVADGDQTLYEAMQHAMASFSQLDGGAAGLARDLQAAVAPHRPEPAEPIEPGFWAARADGDLARLWGDVSAVDHARAAALRSYLWCKGAGGGAVHVTRGLPGPEVLAWLMTDATRPTAPPAAPLPDPQDADTDAAPQMPAPAPERTVPPMANNNDITVRPVEMPRLTD